MQQLSEEYKDKVQFAFKPHPILRYNLRNYWDDERIAEYYGKWETGSNTQLETGGYQGLFMHSDAMIHDSGSFTIEYLYAHKPVMYVVKEKANNHTDHQTPLGIGAFNMHYHGYSKEDIRKFVEQVIADCDPMKEQREHFFRNYLLPPHGKTASENILDAILGKNPQPTSHNLQS